VLPDVLRQQSGMSTYDNVGSPYKINVSTRGFYASPVVGTPQGVSIFVDGVRVNEPDAAEVNFDLLPLEHIKRVEILSGNGTLLGRNSLGGSINLVTRRGEGPPNGEIELMAGTYNSYSAEGSVGATTKSGVDYYVGGNYNYEKGWRQFTRADQWQGFANLGKLGQTSGIRGQFFFSHSYAETAGSLPMSVYEVTPDSNMTEGDFEDLNGLQGALAGYKQMGNGRGSFNLYYRYTDASRFNVNQPADPHTERRDHSVLADDRLPVRHSRRPECDRPSRRHRWLHCVEQGQAVRRFDQVRRHQRAHHRRAEPIVGHRRFAWPIIPGAGDPVRRPVRYDFVTIPFHNLDRRRCTPPSSSSVLTADRWTSTPARASRSSRPLVRRSVPLRSSRWRAPTRKSPVCFPMRSATIRQSRR
jgi:hypothetical protein